MRKGVKVAEAKAGDGAVAHRNSTVRVRYDGFLSRGEPFQQDVELSIDLFRRDVIAGLRYGVEGMRVGGRRRIRVSPHLAYGSHGIPGVIPSNALLVFEVELLSIVSQEERRGDDSDCGGQP